MKSTDLQTTKMSIIEDLMNINDIDVLSSIKRYISGKKERSESPAAMTVSDLKKLLLEQEQNVDTRYIPNDDVMQKLAQWR